MGGQNWNIYWEPLWNEISHSNCNIKIKENKIPEEAGLKDLTRLTDTWDSEWKFFIFILLW